ncbi:MAG: phosphatase PAP2 family protein [Actinomycetota bacterium]
MTVVGYVIMTVILVSLGYLLTQSELGHSIGRWDASADQWFFAQRTPRLDQLSEWGSRFGDTMVVIAITAVTVLILAIGRHIAQIAFLVGALVIEVTSFLTTAMVIERERPAVPRIGEVPPTNSFPSGHTAASTILYVGIALITTSLVSGRAVRVVVWTLAVILPISVGLSRLYRGMHHPTDLVGSMIGAAGCLAFALLATRTGMAAARSKPRDETEPTNARAAFGTTQARAQESLEVAP